MSQTNSVKALKGTWSTLPNHWKSSTGLILSCCISWL